MTARLRLEARSSTCAEIRLDARLVALVDARWGLIVAYERGDRVEAMAVVEAEGLDGLLRAAGEAGRVAEAARRALSSLGFRPQRVTLIVHLSRRLPAPEYARLARIYPRLASLRVAHGECLELSV